MPTMQHIPVDLMVAMQARYGLQQFVETGTYHGQSALLATANFDMVTTCDIDAANIERLAGLQLPPPKRLRAVCVTSPVLLRSIFADPTCAPALVFLDAHWSEGPKLGPECPLLAELRAINGTRGKHVILIDDARLFVNPPPPPHDASQWPTFAQVTALCWELGPTDVVEIVGDVIVVRPLEGKPKCKG